MAAMTLAAISLLATPALGNVALTSPESTECLRWKGEGGCESIRMEEECLSMRDGRPWAQWKGLLIAGQPCSWCGGERCANNSEALCMPYDWVKHRVNLSTANCSKGEPLKAWQSQAPALASQVGDEKQEARFEELANGTRCVASFMEESETVNKYYWTFTASTSDECRAICSARPFCKGFGFEARQQVCKAWWHPIDVTEPSDHGGDACVRAVNERAAEPPVNESVGTVNASVAEPQVGGNDQQVNESAGAANESAAQVFEDQQVMAQNSDDTQGNASGLQAQAGMSDQEKGAIAGGVVGGVAAAGLLGGLLGGLLPHHAASSTTTITTTVTEEILRVLEDNDTNATNESLLLGAAGEGDDGAGTAAWLWWLLAVAALLAAAVCLWLIARFRDAEEVTLESDDDLESLTARSHFAAAEQEPRQGARTLLRRVAPPPDYKIRVARSEPRGFQIGGPVEPVQEARATAPWLSGAGTPVTPLLARAGTPMTPMPPRFTKPVARGACPVVSDRFFEPVATLSRPPLPATPQRKVRPPAGSSA